TDTYEPQIHGVVTSINLFRGALQKLGHQVFIFAPADPHREGKKIIEEGVFRFLSTNSVIVPNIPFTIPVSFKIASKIPKLHLDIIHSHTPATMGLLADYVSNTRKIPHVYTYHTFYPEYIKHYFLKGRVITPKMVAKYDRFYCNRTEQVIAPSAKLKKVLEGFGVSVPINVIPTGLDLAEFTDVSGQGFRDQFNLPADAKILLFVGRIATEKNLEYLLHAFANVAKQEPSTILALVGDGPGRKQYKELARRLNIEKQVLFTGFLDHVHTLPAFFAAKLFLFTSLTDTQGVVIYEAIVSGTPVVMLKDEGLTEAVIEGKTGYSVEGSEADFATQILRILRDQNLYDKLRTNCLKQANALSIENCARKLATVYQEVIGRYHEEDSRSKFWQSFHKQISIPDIFRKNGRRLKHFFRRH
ncbi:MAG: glycosyl transferase group 1, partial [uncultured bacterium]